MKEELSINGVPLDIVENSIKITIQANNIDDFKSRQVSYTLDFDIPSTKRNIEVFEGYGIISSQSQTPRTVFEIKYKVGGLPLIERGTMVVQVIDYLNAKDWFYKAQVLSIGKSLFENLGDSLQDLDFSYIKNDWDFPTGGALGVGYSRLHDLMNKDSKFCYPIAFQVASQGNKADNDNPLQSPAPKVYTEAMGMFLYTFDLIENMVKQAGFDMELKVSPTTLKDIKSEVFTLKSGFRVNTGAGDQEYPTMDVSEFAQEMHDIEQSKFLKDFCFRYGLVFYALGATVVFRSFAEIVDGQNGEIDISDKYVRTLSISNQPRGGAKGILDAEIDYAKQAGENKHTIITDSQNDKEYEILENGVRVIKGWEPKRSYTRNASTTMPEDLPNQYAHQSTELWSFNNLTSKEEERIEWLSKIYVDEVFYQDDNQNIADKRAGFARYFTTEENPTVTSVFERIEEKLVFLKVYPIDQSSVYYRAITNINTPSSYLVASSEKTVPAYYFGTYLQKWLTMRDQYEEISIEIQLDALDVCSMDLGKRYYIKQLGGYFYFSEVEGWSTKAITQTAKFIRI